VGGHRWPKALGALIVSVPLPGAGHLLLGRRHPLCWGIAALGALILTAAISLAVTAFAAPDALLTLASTPTALGVIGGTAILGGLLSVGAVVHLAWLLMGERRSRAESLDAAAPDHEPRRPARRSVIVALSVLLVAVSVCGPGYLAALAFAQQRVLSTVFADGDGIVPVGGRYNILLAGFDAAPGRDTMRPDSIHVASIDAASGHVVLIGVARETRRFPVPPGSGLEHGFADFCRGGCQLNIAYTFGEEHPELYPDAQDPGMAALGEAVTGFTGLELGGYATVDMAGFASLVDAVGGITVQVNEPVLRAGVPDEGRSEPLVVGPPIPTGLQTMDGETALWFARSRLDTSNQERMLRQACLAEAAFRQLSPIDLLAALDAIGQSDGTPFTSDIPRSALAELVRLAMAGRDRPLTVLDLNEPLVTPVQPDTEFVRVAIGEALAGRPVPPRPSVLDGVIGGGGEDAGADARRSEPSAPGPTTPTSSGGSSATDGVSPPCSVPGG